MNRQLKMKDHLFLAGAFLIMAIIFYSSSQSYQEQSITPWLQQLLKSKPFSSFLSQFSFSYGGEIVSLAKSGYFNFVEFFLRKLAHFGVYLLLGVCWTMGLEKRVRDKWLWLLLAFMLTSGYASFDELRQVFHPGRTGLMEDVILDSVGGLVGIISSYLISQKILK